MIYMKTNAHYDVKNGLFEYLAEFIPVQIKTTKDLGGQSHFAIIEENASRLLACFLFYYIKQIDYYKCSV